MGRIRILARLTIATGLAASAVLATAGPAWAKGPQSATVHLKGHDPVEVSWTTADDAFYDLVDASGYWAAMGMDGVDVAVVDPAPAPEDLGMVITVEWHNGTGEPVDGEQASGGLVQLLYPWATGGPVAYVAGGQPTYGDQPTVERWLPLRPNIVDALAGVGFTRDGLVAAVPGATVPPGVKDGAVARSGRSEAKAAAPRPAPAATGDDERSVPVGALAVAGVAGAGGAAVLVWRRRASAGRPARPIRPATAA